MVLQRGMEIPVWGWGVPGSEVKVSFGGAESVALINKKGEWTARLPHAKTATLWFRNVLIGDVWLASGQSNMEWPVAWSKDAEKEIAAATFPQIRLFTVPKSVSYEPAERLDNPTPWQECSPSTVGDFSAVAYFFGRALHSHLDVPIGLIDCSWGGSSMEAWTRLVALQSSASFADAVAHMEQWIADAMDPATLQQYEAAYSRWEQQTGGETHHKDPGNTMYAQGWAEIDFDDSGWDTMALPGFWEQNALPDVDGVVWFRKEVEIPSSWLVDDLTLSLGIIDDTDVTYFNGEQVGAIGLETEMYWNTPRVYTVPADIVREGRNVVAVRVFDHYLGGGFGGPAEKMFLSPNKEGASSIPLTGEWRYKVAVELQQVPIKPGTYGFGVASMLYNGMIDPLIPFGIKGVIWYQGESNADRFAQYRELSELMINDWREQWGQGAFPFLFVQLAGFNVKNWPLLREAQLETLAVPNTAMAVAIDVGDEVDIHPKDKQTVGQRLALAARAIAYGEDIVYSGPIYKSMKIEDGSIRLFFDHVGSGLASDSGDASLRGFTIAGADREFLPARAILDGDTVVVRHPDIENPVAVRYAWNTFPENDLYNREGLPASPFRTDNF